VYTTAGDIALSDVDVSQQTGGNYAAQLTSTSGDITIQSGSSFDAITPAAILPVFPPRPPPGRSRSAIRHSHKWLRTAAATPQRRHPERRDVTLTDVTATNNDGTASHAMPASSLSTM
jgi:hypothetical protein